MTDAVLSQQDRQEGLSRAYVQAVATVAGYSTGLPDFDRDSVDITISAGGLLRPKLDLQLKGTINLASANDHYRYSSLGLKNYNDLRAPTQVPRLLVVLDMPKIEKHWLTLTAEELTVRKAAYWMTLRNYPEIPNKKTVTVLIPKSNRFDVDGLKDLMEKSRSGVIE